MLDHILDGYAQNNALRDTGPGIKLFLGVGAILISVFSLSPYAPVVIALSMAGITLVCAKIPLRLYLSLLSIPLSFSLFSALVILLLNGSGSPIAGIAIGPFGIALTTGGANLAALLLARTFGGMCGLFFIALTTPMIEIFSVMQALRIPQAFIDLSMLIYHFIFVFIGEAIAIHNAQTLRHGFSSFRRSLHSFGMLAAMLFIRAWQAGEALLIAMDSRCYDGKLELSEEKRPVQGKAVMLAVLYLGSCALIAWISAPARIF